MRPPKVCAALIFLSISLSLESRKISFVGALPISRGCSGDISLLLNTSSWCPSPTQQSDLKDNQNPPKCLSQNGLSCPTKSTIVGVGVRNFSINASRDGVLDLGGSCDNQFFVTKSDLEHSATSFCLSTVTSETKAVMLIFQAQSNDSSCILSIQHYNFAQDCQNEVVSSWACRQIHYNCSKPAEEGLMNQFAKQWQSVGFIFSGKPEDLSAKQVNKLNKSNWKEGPQPLVANNTNSNRSDSHRDQRRRAERSEGIRRIKKPPAWNWRNHMLEITIASILALALVLHYCVKRCWEGKLINFHSNPRVVRFEMEETASSADKRRYSSNILPNTSPKFRNTQIDPNRNPSRPILKNSNATNSKQKNKSKPPLNRILGQASAAIKSFDSNTSIYYDALEGPQQSSPEDKSHSQPLIPEA